MKTDFPEICYQYKHEDRQEGTEKYRSEINRGLEYIKNKKTEHIAYKSDKNRFYSFFPFGNMQVIYFFLFIQDKNKRKWYQASKKNTQKRPQEYFFICVEHIKIHDKISRNRYIRSVKYIRYNFCKFAYFQAIP